MLVNSAMREDPLPVETGITHAFSITIEVEAMGAPCTDRGFGGRAQGRVTSSWQDTMLTSSEANPVAEVILFVVENGSLA